MSKRFMTATALIALTAIGTGETLVNSEMASAKPEIQKVASPGAVPKTGPKAKLRNSGASAKPKIQKAVSPVAGPKTGTKVTPRRGTGGIIPPRPPAPFVPQEITVTVERAIAEEDLDAGVNPFSNEENPDLFATVSIAGNPERSSATFWDRHDAPLNFVATEVVISNPVNYP